MSDKKEEIGAIMKACDKYWVEGMEYAVVFNPMDSGEHSLMYLTKIEAETICKRINIYAEKVVREMIKEQEVARKKAKSSLIHCYIREKIETLEEVLKRLEVK